MTSPPSPPNPELWGTASRYSGFKDQAAHKEKQKTAGCHSPKISQGGALPSGKAQPSYTKIIPPVRSNRTYIKLQNHPGIRHLKRPALRKGYVRYIPTTYRWTWRQNNSGTSAAFSKPSSRTYPLCN